VHAALQAELTANTAQGLMDCLGEVFTAHRFRAQLPGTSEPDAASLAAEPTASSPLPGSRHAATRAMSATANSSNPGPPREADSAQRVVHAAKPTRRGIGPNERTSHSRQQLQPSTRSAHSSSVAHATSTAQSPPARTSTREAGEVGRPTSENVSREPQPRGTSTRPTQPLTLTGSSSLIALRTGATSYQYHPSASFLPVPVRQRRS